MEINGFRGQLITADHAEYDDARAIWNGAIDRHPRLIARCSGTADVAAAVQFARDHDLEIAVRGGGHNVAGTAVCDDGIVIDLSAMRAVSVDPDGRTARVQGGALWGDVDHETQAHGLATTGGIVSHTGVAGVTLGGGIGFLMRKHGLAVDNLLAAEVVTAEGGIVRASADEHPDLFWALRGGGGNFGVVTSFRFALHPSARRDGRADLLGGRRHPDVLRFYRDFVAEAPDELGTVVRLGTVPPLPGIPEDLHWRPAIAVNSCYAGAVEDGERAVRALRRFGTPLVDLLAPSPYVDFPERHRRHRSPRVALLLEVDEPRRPLRRSHRRHRRPRLRRRLAPVVRGDVPLRWRRRPGSPRRHRLRRSRRGPQHRHRRRVAALSESGEHAAAETAWARRFLEALQPHRAGERLRQLP